MRIKPDLEETLAFARLLQNAGASVVCVHGRTRQQKGNNPGKADWDVIAKVKAELDIPVVANGGVATFEDAQRCLDATGAYAVMAAVGLLECPSLFANGTRVEPLAIAREYLEFADR